MSFTAAPGGDQYVELGSPLKKRRLQQSLSSEAATAADTTGKGEATLGGEHSTPARLASGGDCVAQRTRSKTLTPEELPSTSSAAAARHNYSRHQQQQQQAKESNCTSSSSNSSSSSNNSSNHLIGVTPQRGAAAARSSSGGSNGGSGINSSNLLNYYRKTRKVSHTRGKQATASATAAAANQQQLEDSFISRARLQASSSAVIAAAAAIDAASNAVAQRQESNNVVVKRLDKKSNSNNGNSNSNSSNGNNSSKYSKYRKTLRNYQQQLLARIDAKANSKLSQDKDESHDDDYGNLNLAVHRRHHQEIESNTNVDDIEAENEENNVAHSASVERVCEDRLDGDAEVSGTEEGHAADATFDATNDVVVATAVAGNSDIEDEDEEQEDDEEQEEEVEPEEDEEEVGFYEIVNSADSSYEEDAQIVAEEDELSEEEDVDDDEEDEDLEEDFDEEEEDLSEGEFAEHIIGELGGEFESLLYLSLKFISQHTKKKTITSNSPKYVCIKPVNNNQ